jgi:formylglycine-generating enzyme required for sulfatase activity
MYPRGDSRAGVSDMIGTVWEWCDDGSGDLHLLKGGSVREQHDKCRIDANRVMRGDVTRDDRGFRPCIGQQRKP